MCNTSHTHLTWFPARVPPHVTQGVWSLSGDDVITQTRWRTGLARGSDFLLIVGSNPVCGVSRRESWTFKLWLSFSQTVRRRTMWTTLCSLLHTLGFEPRTFGKVKVGVQDFTTWAIGPVVRQPDEAGVFWKMLTFFKWKREKSHAKKWVIDIDFEWESEDRPHSFFHSKSMSLALFSSRCVLSRLSLLYVSRPRFWADSLTDSFSMSLALTFLVFSAWAIFGSQIRERRGRSLWRIRGVALD